ncbi:MAG: serine hydrolase [Bacteroidales bacterium]|jgi:CubicO group peptidase (beta-lactamase class C family)|nr:serine hydrolase [Bacteroidales bacterium]
MKYTYIKNILLGVLLICTTATCCCPSESNDSNGSNNHETSLYFPGKDWETTSPETQGYSSEKFAALKAEIEKKYSTTHLMIVVEGKVVFSMGDLSHNARIASCRKSLLSMLYGKYVEDGTINLDATLKDLNIDDNDGLLDIEKKAKVRHLIAARSGVFHPASNTGDDSKHAPKRGSVEPGTYFLYNNWDFNCAGGVFEQLVGMDIYSAFYQDIASLIGMQDYKLANQKKTGDLTLSKYPAYHFWISTRDMARVGYLMLREGEWNGKQIISKDWVKATTSVVTPRSEMNPASRHTREFDYGYLWWIFNKEYTGYDPNVYKDGYTATGLGGQYITVLPHLDMVIAHKDVNANMEKSTYYALIKKIAGCKQ